MRLFRRSSRPAPGSVTGPAPAPVTPEFGVRLTLRKGDRIVRRDARGAIHVTRVTEDRVEVTDICRAGPPASTPPGEAR